MKALRFAAVTLVLAALASPSSAEDDEAPGFFRVEVIVFTHAGGEFDAWPVEDLPALPRDTRDPEWRRFVLEQAGPESGQSDASANADLRSALEVVEAIERLEEGQTTLTELLVYPDPWLATDELSEPMSQALERLRDSPDFRVHHRLGWHQPLEPGRTGTVRIHDDRLLAIDWITLTPTGRLLRDGRPVRAAEQLFPDLRYRLDGTIRLVQRQFMHAEVSLYWHAPETTGPHALLAAEPASRLSRHHLRQSRTIRPDRLEYFDSPWLGVLLRVTPWEADGAASGDGGGSGGADEE